ncbi:putative transferase [Klebsiella michiganensis]|nr:putative transferase [Klebsiella michiganensis]
MKLEHGIAITKRPGAVHCRDAAWWALARLAMKRGDTADAPGKGQTPACSLTPATIWLWAESAGVSEQRAGTKEARRILSSGLEQYPLSYPLHCARWMIAPGDESRAGLLRVTGRRGINGSLLAGWLLSIGQKQAAKGGA